MSAFVWLDYSEREPTAGTHQQAGQLVVALLAGRSSASSRTVQPGLATSVSTSDDAPGKKHRQGGDGQETRGTVVLDVRLRLIGT